MSGTVTNGRPAAEQIQAAHTVYEEARKVAPGRMAKSDRTVAGKQRGRTHPIAVRGLGGLPTAKMFARLLEHPALQDATEPKVLIVRVPHFSPSNIEIPRPRRNP